MNRRDDRLAVVLVLVLLMIVSPIIYYYDYYDKNHGSPSALGPPGPATPYSCPSVTEALSASRATNVPRFSFNNSAALQYYQREMSTLGLESEYPGDRSSVYLTDDQALDYYALRNISAAMGNDPSASMLAQNISNAMEESFGGLFMQSYPANPYSFDDNPAFSVVGHFPGSNVPVNGSDYVIQRDGQYSLKAVEFEPNPNFNFSLFADLAGYYVLYYLHSDQLEQAEGCFSWLNAMWDGHGFADEPFQDTLQYQSFKLAVYLIDWEVLNDTSATHAFAQNYDATAQSVSEVMSMLQSSQSGATLGGVWTGYEVSSGNLEYGTSVSSVNGETTSLFAIAWGLW